jgi:hypothetical protein
MRSKTLVYLRDKLKAGNFPIIGVKKINRDPKPRTDPCSNYTLLGRYR